MKPKDHQAVVYALDVVVRRAAGEVAAKGRTVPDETRAAIEAAEAWLQGQDIDATALQAAADLSYQDGVPFAQREKDRAVHWLRTAAGNLAWMAKKDRGWKDGDRSVLDAAVNTLSCLGIPGEQASDEIEGLYKASLAKAPPAPKDRKKTAPKAKPLSTNLSAHIGAAANKLLAKRSPVFDLATRGSESELRGLLAERRYAIHDAVLAYDARYGGLVAAEAGSTEGDDWIFGAYACLKSDGHEDPRGGEKSRVPVAYSPNDVIFYIDVKGVVWVIDTIEDLKPVRFADTADAMMTRIFSEK